jgi:predicted O-methyltransferase YrrM
MSVDEIRSIQFDRRNIYPTLWQALESPGRVMFAFAKGSVNLSPKFPLTIRLREYPGEFQCASFGELTMLMAGVYICQRTRWPPYPYLPRLMDLSARVNGLLSDDFRSGRRAKSAVGGSTSYKEALLYWLTLLMRPKLVVETGVAQGISSTFILAALDINGTGKLISVDLPRRTAVLPFHRGEKRDLVHVREGLDPGWIVPESFRSRWELRIGRSSEVLPTLGDGTLQLFLHDSLHTYENMSFEYEWAWRRLDHGGVLVSDDIGWNHAFRDFMRRHDDGRALSDRSVGVIQRVQQNA